MGKVLVVYHSQGGNTRAAAEAVVEGARSVEGTRVELMTAIAADQDDLLGCDALAVGSPNYFSYMAGRVKDFFDRTFYPTQGEVEGKPCGIFVTEGGGSGAAESIQRICDSFNFELLGDPVRVKNAPDQEARGRLRALGAALARRAT